MYYVLLVALLVVLVILLIIIYNNYLVIRKQRNINYKLKMDNDILLNIDKYQINYLKNGYQIKKYKGKILVGDYDVFSLSNTISAINALGYDTDVVKNASDILFKLKSSKYDFIITNYQYPNGINGIELCDKIKKLKINTPIIILSSTSDMRDEFIKYADYYLEKPLNKKQLKEILITNS